MIMASKDKKINRKKSFVNQNRWLVEASFPMAIGKELKVLKRLINSFSIKSKKNNRLCTKFLERRIEVLAGGL